MTTSRLRRAPLFAVLSVGLVACASSGGGPAQEEPEGQEVEAGAELEEISVEIINDYSPSSQATIWIVPFTGSREQIGTVAPGEQRFFYYTPNLSGIQYRLRAEGTGGQTPQTNPFSLDDATRVTWRLSDTNVTVSR